MNRTQRQDHPSPQYARRACIRSAGAWAAMAAFVLGLSVCPSFAANTTWLGAEGDSWSNAAFWSGGVPSSSKTAVLDNGNTSVITTSSATCGDLFLGSAAGTSGLLSVGSGGSLSAYSYIYVGTYGNGTLSISDGGKVSGNYSFSSGATYLGRYSGSTGTVTVTGADSTLSPGGMLYVGYQGAASLTISDGGQLSHSTDSYLGRSSGATGTATVTGANSTWTNYDSFTVGHQGIGSLTIADGGQLLRCSDSYLGRSSGSTGTVTVTGANSTWNSYSLYVGYSGVASLAISNGGVVADSYGYVGYSSGSTGNVTVTGANSTWSHSSNLTIGSNSESGTGTVTVSDGALLSVARSLRIWNTSTLVVDNANLSIGAIGGNGTISITHASGQATLTLGSSSSDTYSGNLADSGGTSLALTKIGTGVQAFSGTNTYTGTTTVAGGVLRADDGVGLPTSSALVLTNGVWEMSGSPAATRILGTAAGQIQITGGASGFSANRANVTIKGLNGGNAVVWTTSGGLFSPEVLVLNAGTANKILTFQDDLNLNDAAGPVTRTIAVNLYTSVVSGVLSQSGAAASLTKTGDGTLVLSGVNTYSGSTTVAGGELRAEDGVGLPSGSNLILNGGVWELTANTTRVLGTGAGQIQIAGGNSGFVAYGANITLSGLNGGNAIVWTTSGGPFSPDVLVLNTSISTRTLMLRDDIDLNDSTTEATRTVSVNGTGSVSTISGVLNQSGASGGLTKVGVGTLALTGANTYSGATTVAGGAIRAEDGVGLPSGSNLILNGGVWELTANTTRVLGTGAGQIQITGGNSGFTAYGASIALSGLNGGNPIVWTTSGGPFSPEVLVLNRSSADSPLAFLDHIDMNDTTAAVNRTIAVNSTTMPVTIRGVLSHSGAMANLTKVGAGTLILTAANTYTGITTVSAGTLQLGDGETTNGSVAGDIVNQGNVTFANPYAQTYSRNITGSGALIKIGAGSLTLTGNNTFTGAATINAGVLAVVGAGRVSASGTMIGFSTGSSGAATVDGTGSTWTNTSNLYVGYDGAGSLAITNGGLVSDAYGYVGYHGNSTGSVLVTGANSTWSHSTNLIIGGGSGPAGTGTVTVSDGALLSVADTLCIWNTGTLVVDNANLSIGALAGNGTLSIIHASGSATLTLGASFIAIYSGSLADTSGTTLAVTKVGANTQTFSGSNTYTGTTTVTGGVLRADDGVGLPSGSNLVLNGGAWEMGANPSATRVLGTGAGQIQITGGTSGFSAYGANVTLSGLNGGSDVVWTTSGLFSPDVLVLNASTANRTLTFQDDIDLNDTTDSVTRTIAVNNTTAPATISGVLGNSGAVAHLTKVGVGALALTGANTYGGTTTVAGGALRAEDGVGLPSGSNLILKGGVWEMDVNPTRVLGTGAGQIQIPGGVSGFSAYGASIAISGLNGGNPLVWTTSGGLFSPSSLVLNGYTAESSITFLDNIDLNASATTVKRTIAVNSGTAPASISGVLSNSGAAASLVKDGFGTLILSAANTYGGSTTVAGGELRAEDGVGLPSGSNLILNGGVWEMDVNTTRVLGTGAGQIQITGGASGFSAYGAAITISNLNGGSPLVWTTSGGPFSPSDLVLNGATADSPITFLDNIDLNANTTTASRGISVDSLAAPVTIRGVLSQSGGMANLAKWGDGTLILTANNTYSGNTTIRSGALQLGDGTSSNGSVVGPIINNATLIFANPLAQSFSRNITGTGSLIKTGAGTLSLTGNVALSRTVTVDGGSLVLSGGGRISGSDTYVGYDGNASVTITNGVFASSTSLLGYQYLGYHSGSIGRVTVDGSSSEWDYSNSFYVGYDGEGSFIVANGGRVSSASSNDRCYVGFGSGSIGRVTVTGSGSMWDSGRSLYVGYDGDGAFTVANGGVVSSPSISYACYVGYRSGSTGTVTVDGYGSTWSARQYLYIGYSGTGALTITNGGTVSASTGYLSDYVGYTGGSTGVVTVDGPGSAWSGSNSRYIGYYGDGALVISNGGSVTNGFAAIGSGAGSNGNVIVDGSGSTWVNSGSLYIAPSGSGSLTISNGGSVVNSNAYVGVSEGASGTVTVTGANSTWTNSAGLTIGGTGPSASGSGLVTVTDGGVLRVAGILRVSSTGTLIVDGGTLSAGALAGNGTVSITSASGAADLTLSSSSGSATYSGNLADTGTTALALFKTGTGTQILSGNNTYSGGTTVQAGTLLATNSSGSATGSGSVVVQSGATLGGTGSVGASGQSVTIQSNATLSPGSSPGVLSVLGDLAVDTGALLTFELNDPGNVSLVSDRVDVSGALSLADGVLMDVTIDEAYAPQVGDQWTLFNYSSLSGNATDITLHNVTSSAGSALEASLSADAGSLVMTITAVPEPSTLAMLAGGGLLGTWLWRRRRRGNRCP